MINPFLKRDLPVVEEIDPAALKTGRNTAAVSCRGAAAPWSKLALRRWSSAPGSDKDARLRRPRDCRGPAPKHGQQSVFPIA